MEIEDWKTFKEDTGALKKIKKIIDEEEYTRSPCLIFPQECRDEEFCQNPNQ